MGRIHVEPRPLAIIGVQRIVQELKSLDREQGLRQLELEVIDTGKVFAQVRAWTDRFEGHRTIFARFACLA